MLDATTSFTPDDDAYWAVAQTIANHENFAGENLKHRGFETLPLRCRQRVGKVTRVVALFPGYLLVKIIGGRFWEARFCVGVVRLLMRGDRPIAFPQGELERLLVARDPHTGIVKLPKHGAPTQHVNGFARGDVVRIVSGSFTGLHALYEGLSAHERIVVLMDILGRRSRVELAPDDKIAAIASRQPRS
jgi:transcriptional antiterminator RfaH